MKRSQHLIKTLKCILIICLVGFANNIGNAQGGCFGVSAPQMSFSSSGGTISKTIQHNCSGGRFTVGSKPNWLTVSISGSRVTATAPAYSGAERKGNIVLLYNGSTSGGVSVVQNKGVKPPPPPPCSISGFTGSTFSATGQTKNYTLSYSNCPSNIYFTFKRVVNGQEQNLPSWIQVSQPSSGRVSVTFSRNSGTSSRNVVLIGKRQDGGTPGIGGTFVQHCIEKTWYADSDNDGFRDPGSTPQKDCVNRGSGWTQNTTVDVCPSEYNEQNTLKNWYRDTDNDGYRDPDGEMRSQCNKPTNGHWTLSTKNDQCPSQPGPGSGTNGCDPDCASGYLREDGTSTGPPASNNIPVEFSFSEDGGTAWVEMVFPDGSCATPYNPVFEDVPGWLTLTPASGNRIKIVCSAYTTRGGERHTQPPVRVEVINNVFIGTISVAQDGPPLPCTVSGNLDGTFDENGEELTFPLTYDNCSEEATYDIKRSDGSALPDWATVIKDGPDEITIRLDRNDEQSSRTLTVVATGINDSSLSVGGQLTQSCDLQTWYKDKDNDGWAEFAVEACSQPTPTEWYKLLADIEGTGDCDDDDSSINPGTTWYEDTDGDNYKDPNGAIQSSCTPPATGNWTNSPESVDDQCPNQSAPGPGTNGCDPDCASGYLREDGTSTDPPASNNIPVEFSFSEDGGTGWVEMVFPDGSCTSPYNPVFEDVPGWLTLTVESGNRIKLVCSAYTTAGGERRTQPPVRVKVINNVFIGNISVVQDGPPVPCTVSGSLDGTFDENGEELTFPLTYNNCSAQTTTYDLKRPDGSALPDWVTVVKEGPDEITIRLDRNDEQSSRTLTVVAKAITDSSLSVGGQLTQSCDLQTWYKDKDNDGWADFAVETCSRPTPAEWYKVLADIEGTGDCDDDDPLVNPGTIWYEDTDGDNYKDPNGEVVEACSPPEGNWTSDPRSLDDLCLDHANSTEGSNGCNLDCLPFSIDPGIIEFTDQGGTQTATVKIGCTSGYTIEVQPTSYDWLTINLNGTSLELECDPGTEAKDITINLTVNGNSGGGLRVKRNPPPPPPSCEADPISNVVLGAFADSQSVTVTFVEPSNCSGAIYLGHPYEESVPQWLNIEPSANTFTLSAGINDTGTTRTTTLAVFRDDGTGTGTTVPVGVSFNITQASCLMEWFLDADGDGHASERMDSCYDPGTGWTERQMPVDDCDDTDPEMSGETTWYEDEDGDGWGDPLNYITQCTVPVGYVSNNSDLCPMVHDTSNNCNGTGSPVIAADNYLYTRTYQSESLTASDFFTENDDLIQDIAYYDGLGRPVQQIGIDYTPAKYDIVTPITYDDYSRQHKEYLPYAVTDNDLGTYRPDALSGTHTFYDTPKYQNTANPYSEKEFEPSPLNRVLKQAAPGEEWKLIKNADDHSIEFAYLTNIQDPNNPDDLNNDNVRLFQVDLSGGDENPALAENGFYSEGELYKNITKDENHDTADGKLHTTEEYTDKQGRVVLKRNYADLSPLGGDTEGAHDTYYVYDDYGNLTYVLPPKMEASTASLTDINTHLAELGYQYVYDHRNRLVEKRIPGKGEEYIIYNKLDQPIMTQDANQRAKSPDEWLFTKYDGLGRVAYTGIAVETGDYSREQIQEEVDAFTDPLWVIQSEEEVTFGGTDIYYNNGAYPNNTAIPDDPMVVLDEVLTIHYYDTYVDGPSSAPASETPLGSDSETTHSDALQGLPTVARVKVLDVPGPNVWINTQTYYDAKGRVIQTYSHNAYLETIDIVETQLDFIGKPIKVRTSHTRNGMTIVTIDNFSYDHNGRLLAQTQCIGDGTLGEACPTTGNLDEDLLWDGLGTINSDTGATHSITVRNADIVPGTGGTTLRIVDDGGQELIVYNNYDELGQLAHKKVGGTPGSDYSTSQELQEVDYKYNVRGWLTDINDISDAVPDKLFNFKLSYDQSPDPLYNGNISQTQWRTANTDNTLKSYGYTYDALNRITSALDNSGNYDVSHITYDKMGNILTLKRNGWQDEEGTIAYPDMDILDYDYGPGNKLTKVSDMGNVAYGFRDGTNTDDDYAYDANGNMTRDLNKGIGTSSTDGITYNHLNLPTGIEIGGGGGNGTIDYIYDATGLKLKKQLSNGNSTEYAGNYIYEGGNLVQFFHLEGYVEPDGSGGYSYIYQYIDHLGNVRLSYSDLDNNGSIDAGSEILQERNYYPFGLEHKGNNNMIQGVESNYKQFQGQEWTEDLGLNIHEWKYRVSDPTIGRFWQIDPLAEDYSYQSPYNFSENRVIDSAELEGLERIFAADGKFIDQAGDSQEIRVLNNRAGDVQGLIGIVNNPDSSPEDVEVAQKTLNSVSHHGFESMDEAAGNFAFNYNVASIEADKEFGAVLNTVTLSNEDGNNIEGTNNNTVVVRGPKVEGAEDKVGTNVIKAAKDAGTPGVLSGLVHTHGNESNDFSRGGDMGGLLRATDESTSRSYNIPVYMSNKRGQLKVLDVNRGRDETLPKRVPK
ncbi:DUF6443 domain-containing protein [Ulvibacterium sp.]|uniref:DUF6443 domain-containing protein n=1 Tax=Ulvibacterium sp. TaxID=2665914 RepID=UPI003CC60C88